MAREGIQSCGELGIRAVALPEQTDTYTVISHGFIIDKVREELTKNNFEIEREEFLYSYGGEVVLSKVHIKSSKDSDMGMVFTWWNSYNKQVKFGCAIGGFIYDNKTSLIGSDGMTWIRKHTGTADTEASNIMEQLIAHANVYFDKIIAEKEKMKAMPLSIESFGCIMGALYFELELISPTQASLVRQEYKKPKHEYKDKDTLWGLYKLIMFGIDEMDLRKWATNQQKIHFTIMNEYALATEEENIPEELAAELHLAETTFMNARELELKNELETDTFAMAQFSGVKAPEQLNVQSLKCLVIDASDVDMSEVTWVAPDVTGNFTFKQEEEIPEHHKPLIPTQEELDAEHVGPPEMYLGDAPVAHVESDEEYHKRVAEIEGEPEPIKIEVAPERVKFAINDPIEVNAKEVFREFMLNEKKEGEHLVSYFIDNHYCDQFTAEENVVLYDKWNERSPITTLTATEIVKEVELITPEESKEKTVKVTPIKTEALNAFDDDLLEASVTKIELPPVTIPEGFEWLLEDDGPLDTISTDNFEEGLNVPQEVLQLAKDVEAKMNELYGRISPYTYIESNDIVIVTIGDSNEVFYI
jgi:hypothetical protein